MRIGVIRNPKSGRNRNAPPLRTDFGGDDLLLATPRRESDLAEVLAHFRRRDVRLVIIDGGDGTVREVLTALPATYGANLPLISILSSGQTNLIAREVGTAGYGQRAFERLVTSARDDQLKSKLCERPGLEVSWRDGARPPLRGMLFGAAAFVVGTDFAAGVHRRGVNQGPAVLATIASAIVQSFGRKSRERWRAGQDIDVQADGVTRGGRRFLFLATTLHRLMLGLWPFWGGDDRPIRYVDVPATNLPLMSFALPLLRGRPTRRMLANGFRSGNADEVTLSFSGPFILDGEKFDSGTQGVQLRAGPTFRFVSS